jgi:hypothetical protein
MVLMTVLTVMQFLLEAIVIVAWLHCTSYCNIFQIEVTGLNRMCILCHVAVFVWWGVFKKFNKYCHVSQWLRCRFGLVIGFLNHLQVVTTNNYYTIADLRYLQSLHTKLLSLFPLIFTIHFLATDL